MIAGTNRGQRRGLMAGGKAPLWRSDQPGDGAGKGSAGRQMAPIFPL